MTDKSEEQQEEEEEEEEDDDSELAAAEEAAAAAKAAADAEAAAAAAALREAIVDYLDTLSDLTVYDTVKSLEDDVHFLPIENEIFENFLLINEPILLAGMDVILETAAKLKKGHLYVAVGSEESLDQGSMTSTRTSVTEKCERINVSQRTDLVLREVEDLQKNLVKFVIKMKRKSNSLKAELEEIGIEQAEVNDWTKSFETIVVIEGLEEITGRIPAEKFLKYMHDWLKNQQFLVEKMRLRLATTKDKFNKTRVIHAQKEEEGESIREVDFEKIIIENQTYIEQVEQKNIHLVELKKMTGRANLVLSNHKKYLLAEVENLKQLEIDVENIKLQNKELLEENEEVLLQVEKEKVNYDKIKTYVESYSVPELLDYVNIKHNLYNVKKEVKALVRKRNLLKISLHSKLMELKRITGLKRTQTKWLLPLEQKSLESLSSLDSLLPSGLMSSDDGVAMSYINVDFSEHFAQNQIKNGPNVKETKENQELVVKKL